MIHNLYYSPNIIRVIKSRRVRWACGTDGQVYTKMFARNPEGNLHLGRSGRRWII